MAALPGLRLQLIRLEYADDNEAGAWGPHRASPPPRQTFIEAIKFQQLMISYAFRQSIFKHTYLKGASSSSSHLTHLRKLAPQFPRVEPSAVCHPPFVQAVASGPS